MRLDEIVRELRRLAENSRSKHDVLVAAADLIESLQAQLAESQRREQAAVEDLKSANLCRHCGLNASCGSEIRSNRRAFGVCKRWEYRGPQEAGKGEAE